MSDDQPGPTAHKTPWLGIIAGSAVLYFLLFYVLPVIVGEALRGAGWAAGAATKTVTEGWTSGRR